MTAIKFLGCCIVIAACYMTGINPGLWYIAAMLAYIFES